MQSERRGKVKLADRSLVRRHGPDHSLIMPLAALLGLGLVVLFSISVPYVEQVNAGGSGLDQQHFIERQILFLLLGIGAFVAASMMPLQALRRLAWPLVLTGLGLCALLYLMGLVGAPLAICHNGACRWINAGFINFQPAELLKMAVMIFAAGYLAQAVRDKTLNDFKGKLVPLLGVVGAALFFIVLLQKDMGTGITLLGIILMMFFAAGVSWRNLGIMGGGLAALGVLAIVIAPHRIARVITFFDPSAASEAANHHIEMASIAIGSGGVMGKGLGESIQAFGYLPEALNDSVFAVLGETFGLVGLTVIIFTFVILLQKLLMTAEHTPEVFYRMIVMGVFGWIATHVVVNISAMIGLIPLTGVTLPFLSYGGTSLIVSMAALGFAYQASRYTSHQTIKETTDEGPSGRRRFGWSRHAN